MDVEGLVLQIHDSCSSKTREFDYVQGIQDLEARNSVRGGSAGLVLVHQVEEVEFLRFQGHSDESGRWMYGEGSNVILKGEHEGGFRL
jgi:hypothetical protein